MTDPVAFKRVDQLPPLAVVPDDALVPVWSAGALHAAPQSSLSISIPPDATTVINVPADYPSLNDALAAIGLRFIPSTSFVDIMLASGPDTLAAASVFRHPCGERIRIKGTPYIQKSISSLQSVTGTPGAYLVTINVGDTTGIATGDYAVVAARGGTGPWQIHSGAWEITNVDTVSNRVTVKNTARNAAFPVTTLTSGTVNVLRTVLHYNGFDGVRVEGSKLGLLQNVMIVGNGAGDFSGINVAGHDGVGGSDIIASKMNATGSLVCGEFVGVSGFGANGIVCNHGSSVFANSVACSNNGKYGFYAAVASAIEARECCGNGNGTGGVIADYGGSAWVAGAQFCGNLGNGIFVFNGGHVIANEVACIANTARGVDARFGDVDAELATCNYNETGGVLARNGSRLAFDGSTASFNTGPGAEAYRGGVIRAEGITASNNSTFGIFANMGGYIAAPTLTAASNGTANRRIAPTGVIEDETGVSWNQAFVRATISVDQTISTGTETLLNFNTEQLDSSGEFGSSTYTATVVKSFRRLRVTVAVDMNITVVDQYELRLKKNGTLVSTSIFVGPTGAGRSCLILTDIFEIVPGDTIAAYIFQNSGSNKTVRGGATLTRLLIEEI